MTNPQSRGYFEIGIYCGKTKENLGTLWRSAYQLGASGIFTIGDRHPAKQSSDTYKSWRHLPYRRYTSVEEFLAAQPYNCQVVGVEFPGKDLITFQHPERAMYLLGSEDNGLPKSLIENNCQHVVQLPSVRMPSYNVAAAGTIVMFDRYAKAVKSPTLSIQAF